MCRIRLPGAWLVSLSLMSPGSICVAAGGRTASSVGAEGCSTLCMSHIPLIPPGGPLAPAHIVVFGAVLQRWGGNPESREQ